MTSVRCLLGRPHRLLPAILSEIGESHRAGHACVLLVPEQFTLQAELELTERLRLQGFFTIQVLSPTRLTQRVFEYAGSPQRIRMDGRGKSMLLRLILEEHAERLTFYRSAARSAGFIEKLSALIAEIKASEISPEQLTASAAALPEGALRQKMQDTALLYAQYEQRLAGQFSDGEDVEKALVERLPASGVLRGTHLWIYGFDMLTHSFSRQLLAFAEQTSSLTVALSMDTPPAADASLFTPVAESLIRFEQLLDAQGIAHRRERVDTPLQAPASIRHLEKHLFAFPAVAYPGVPVGLGLHAAASPHAQVHHAAATVLSLLREEGYVLSQLSIQYPPGSDEFPRLLRQTLPQYGITAHVQEKRLALHHPMVQMLLAALRCLTHHFRQEDVLSFLKSGFSPLPDEDCFALENHALAYGLRGNAWLQPLQKGDAAQLAVLEPLRAALLSPLLSLREGLRATRTTEAALRAIFDFLLELDVPGKLQAEQDTLRNLSLAAEISYSTQVWNALMQLLSQLHTLLPTRRVRLSLVLEMLQAGLSATELQVLPPEADMLICGEVGNVRAEGIRVLFLVGMNDRSAASPAALLDDGERQQVEQSLGAHMGMQQAHRQLLRRIDLLTALSLPTERLYVGWCQSDSVGQALRPDITIHTLRRLFPEAGVSGGALDDGAADMLCAPGPALSALSLKLRDALSGLPLEPVWQAALGCLTAMPEASSGLRLLRNALHARFQPAPLPQATIAQATLQAVYSVSRLETFAACPFRHYVRYLLAPQPRKIYGVYRQDLGTFYHDALQAYAQQARQTASWPQLSREENEGLLLNAAAPLLEEWVLGPLGEDARTRAQGREVLRIAQASAWAIARQAQASDFRPEWLEFSFGLETEGPPALTLALPDGGSGSLHGRIDRIDTWRDEAGHTWASIIDYKSGALPKLSSALLRWGLQLQLPLYLSAVLSLFPDTRAAGAYYVPLRDPLVSSMSEDPQEIATAWEKELVPQGFSTKLPEGVAVPPGKGAPLSPAQVSALLSHAEAQAGAHISAIQRGVIDASPMGESQHLPCSYCDYQAICGLDATLEDAKARIIPKEKKLPEVLEQGFSDVPCTQAPIRL